MISTVEATETATALAVEEPKASKKASGGLRSLPRRPKLGLSMQDLLLQNGR
jgi:hypothetical protein